MNRISEETVEKEEDEEAEDKVTKILFFMSYQFLYYSENCHSHRN
jgi:hypothetical protein